MKALSEEQQAGLQGLADITLSIGRDLFARGTVRDAVAWEDARLGIWRVAWIVDPKRMERMGVVQDGSLPMRGPYVARIMKQYGMKGTSFEWEREMVMGDFLERVANELLDLIPEGEEIRVTIIPEPGYPWPAEDDVYYSARKGRWEPSERPSWLLPDNVVMPEMAVDSPGVDLCRLFPEEDVRPMGAEAARYGRKPDDYFLVTHAMGTIEGVTRFGTMEGIAGWEENASFVQKCGGLLFPSMAVGAFPAANFGVGILVADVGLVLNSLKPYRKRGDRSQVRVYNTDAWSGRTQYFFQEAAVAAFQQLHGLSDYIYHHDLNVWPLGAPRSLVAFGTVDVEEIERVPQLKRELRDRFRTWYRGMEPEAIEAIEDQVALTPARYPYLEAKVNGVMPLSDFPMAVVARQQEEGFRHFLKLTGFVGELLVVDVPAEVYEVMDAGWAPSDLSFERRKAIQSWAWMEYGWNVADAIRQAGRETEV